MLGTVGWIDESSRPANDEPFGRGEEERLAMGRPPLITREQVAEAALRIIDDEGVDALSMERIGREVGVRGPTLYHHFSDKAEILAEAAGLVLGRLVDHDPADWQDYMISISLAFYGRLVEHPNAAAMLMQSLPDTAALPGMERAARLLDEAGVDPSLHLLLMEGTEKITWGWSLQRAAMLVQGERLSPSKLVRRWPTLARAAAANTMTDEEMLERAIRAFHAGVLGK